jgi:hypothetical protein
MPECRCRTEAADYQKKCRCWTNLSPSFQHLHFSISFSMKNTISSCLWTCRVYQFRHALGIPFITTNNSFFKCQNVGLCGIPSVRYRNKQKIRCRTQSGTGIRGPSPVPEYSGTCLRYRMLECRCRRHRPQCRCPAMHVDTV